MQDISKLIFLKSLNASFSHGTDIRVVVSNNELGSRQWISKYCRETILDLGDDDTVWRSVQKGLDFDPSDWTFSVQYFQAFTARELHYAVQTEQDLHTAVTKALTLLDRHNYSDIDEVLEVHGPQLDVGIWVESQRARFTTTKLKELLSQYFVLTAPTFSSEYSEYLFTPIYGEEAVKRFCKLLNDASVFEDHRSVVFYVRLGDLPHTLHSDDADLKLINWLCDKQMIPRDYTTVEKCEFLAINDPVAEPWLRRARQLFD